jgi:hypothetical protein
VRALVFLSLIALPAAAQPLDVDACTDAYTNCHDDCSLRFGMVTRDTERIKLAKCIDKCRRADSECRERFFETKNNALDDDALKKKKERDDDLREDNKKTAIVPDEQKPVKKKEEPAEKRTATRASDLDQPKKEEPQAEPQAKVEDKPAPAERPKDDPPPKKKKKDRSLDEWDPEAL